MRMAKASEEERKALWDFFNALEEKTGDPNVTLEEIGDYVERAIDGRDGGHVGAGWRRVLWGFETMLEAACHPDEDCLAWKPQLSVLLSRPLIFLDIDGVLVTDGKEADPDCVKRLNHITCRVPADIVVTSTWRHEGFKEVAETLKGWGVRASVIDITPDLSVEQESGLFVATTRGAEITQWFLNNRTRPWPPFVIIDDDDDMGGLSPQLVQTNAADGLTKHKANTAIAFLRAPEGWEPT